MSRNIFILLAIGLQILILSSFVVRYEILKATGTTVYVPLRGYDPTDIFRGDYVNLSYELPYNGGVENESSYYSRPYVSIELSKNSVLSISRITGIKPESGIFFQIQNYSISEKEFYTIKTASGKTLPYESLNQCRTEAYKVGDPIKYTSWGSDEKVNSITKQPESESKIPYGKEYYKDATIESKSECIRYYRFRTTATDRWFVPEGTGLELERKIREGDIYAKWKIGGNGAVVITGIINKKELPN